MTTREAHEDYLARMCAKFCFDPVGYADWAWDWGYGDLAGFPDGLDGWQRELFGDLSTALLARGFDPQAPRAAPPIQIARSSGHGIGKSAAVGMLTQWLMSCWPDTRGLFTATTGAQLRTRTWPEIHKWNSRSLTGHWFEVGTGGLYMKSVLRPESWRIDGATCRPENSEAFQGLHNAAGVTLYVCDEASGVPNEIMQAIEGSLTDGQPIWLLFGNPTRSSGYFADVFGKRSSEWLTAHIDSRTARIPNKQRIEQQIKAWGEDSDYIRVRVRGLFPRQSSWQFIASDRVAAARGATPRSLPTDPLIGGLDVARSGENESVLAWRLGYDASSIPWTYWRIPDLMKLADAVAYRVEELRSAGIVVSKLFIDATGLGAGVYDRLVQMGYGDVVVAVSSGESALLDQRYRNLGVEMWDRLKDAIQAGLTIPDDDTLSEQLTKREYGIDEKGRLFLESKDDLRARGEDSPDRADALALTYAKHVAPVGPVVQLARRARAKTDFNPYASRRT